MYIPSSLHMDRDSRISEDSVLLGGISDTPFSRQAGNPQFSTSTTGSLVRKCFPLPVVSIGNIPLKNIANGIKKYLKQAHMLMGVGGILGALFA